MAIYGATWGFTLSVFHSGLIHYYPLETGTWILIVGAWLAFILGSITVSASNYALGKQLNNDSKNLERPAFIITEKELDVLHRMLWILNIILVIHISYEIYNVRRLMGGSIANIFLFAGSLYKFRVQEGLPGSIPYIGSFVLFATVLAGIYTSSIGRLKFVALIPVFIAIISSFLIVVRSISTYCRDSICVCLYFKSKTKYSHIQIYF